MLAVGAYAPAWRRAAVAPIGKRPSPLVSQPFAVAENKMLVGGFPPYAMSWRALSPDAMRLSWRLFSSLEAFVNDKLYCGLESTIDETGACMPGRGAGTIR